MTIVRTVRALRRAVVMLVAVHLAFAHFAGLRVRRRRRLTFSERARWLQTWCRCALKVLAIEVEINGQVPRSGLLVSNHLSYLDILVFAASTPTVFVAKAEVFSWLFFGRAARLAGTIFTDRRSADPLANAVAQAEAVLDSGVTLLVFPEATTTDGSRLLPFRPALFEAAVRRNAPVTAGHIAYTHEDGTFARSLCWWGKVHLARHVAQAFSHRSVRALLRVGSPARRFHSRKEAASTTFAEVTELHRQFFANIVVPAQPVRAGTE